MRIFIEEEKSQLDPSGISGCELIVKAQLFSFV